MMRLVVWSVGLAMICASALSDAFTPRPPLRCGLRSRRKPETSFPLHTGASDSDSKASSLTDWVVENLEGGEVGSVTSESSTKAGENDTLPSDGLRIGRFRVLPSGSSFDAPEDETDDDGNIILNVRILLGRNGWGTGVHPTTRLCLEWLAMPDVLLGGESVLDYGCGSGIFSIASLGLGASSAMGVDVEAEALITAERNAELNGFDDRFEGLHVREVLPSSIFRPAGADVITANILVGQLVRPSMVSAIVTNLAPKGLLCLSGIRPSEVDSLKQAYGEYIEWVDKHCAELAASDTIGSFESYGFDVGTWSRLVGRVKKGGGLGIEAMSELAVS